MPTENFFSFSILNKLISDPNKDVEKDVIKWREIQYFSFKKNQGHPVFFLDKSSLDWSFRKTGVSFKRHVCAVKH